MHIPGTKPDSESYSDTKETQVEPSRLPQLDATASQQQFQLDVMRLKYQHRLVLSMLSLVGFLTITPLAVSLVRRPPDNVVNQLYQATLLLTGGLTSAVGILVGMGISRKNESNTVDPVTPPSLANNDA